MCKNCFRQLEVKDDAGARVEAKCLGKLMELVEAGNVAIGMNHAQQFPTKGSEPKLHQYREAIE
ncbi:hypothetical protein [Pseudovibrio sp. Tun.PSC04-5.I4]|uniref:hypothetical protein n=1 Tax=Pseudovibrio sp. Tun.PSC04-5.I4 TaxID=1798213 RepID=UPI00117AB45F|nr:hypothetical protein [Pseudovibrio sp. Tun.PSC04-5.I4]